MTNFITRIIENPDVSELQAGDLLTFEIEEAFDTAGVDTHILTLPIEARGTKLALQVCRPQGGVWYIRWSDGRLAYGNERLIEVEREVELPCEVSFEEIRVGDRIEHSRTYINGNTITANVKVDGRTVTTLRAGSISLQECSVATEVFTLLERPGERPVEGFQRSLDKKARTALSTRTIEFALKDAGLELVRKEAA